MGKLIVISGPSGVGKGTVLGIAMVIGVAVGLLTPQDEIETDDFEMKFDM